MTNKNLVLVLILCVTYLNGLAQDKFTLNQAVDYALKSTVEIKNATLDIKAAKYKKWETTTMGLPQINANVDYQNFIKQSVSLLPASMFGGPEGEYTAISFGTKQNMNASATLSQLLFDGSYLVALQSSKVYLKISKLAKIKTEKNVKEATIIAYGNVLLAKESILIIKNNLKLIDKTIHDTSEIYKNGLAEEQDVEQLQITRATLNNQLQKSIRLLVIAKNMLKITMGIEIQKPIELTDTLENLVTTQQNLALSNASFNVENHIDYQMFKNSVSAKELFLKLEKSKYLPQLTSFINVGAKADNDDFTFTDSTQKWYFSSLFGVSLHVPVFSSFKRNARVQQAKVALKQEKNNLSQVEQKLKLQVENAKANYQFAIDSYNTSKQNVTLAKRIEKKEQIKFFEGLGSSFNLTTAQNQLYTTQQNYLQTIVAIINTKAKLENALNK